MICQFLIYLINFNLVRYMSQQPKKLFALFSSSSSQPQIPATSPTTSFEFEELAEVDGSISEAEEADQDLELSDELEEVFEPIIGNLSLKVRPQNA